MIQAPKIAIVVPCYNEEEVLPWAASELSALIDQQVAAGHISSESYISFVDDGSSDATWTIILAMCESRPDRFSGIKLSKNRGHQSALLAGLATIDADAAISIDADLQDDIRVIPDMVRYFQSGCEVVCGVRSSRKADTLFKNFSARAYYRLMKYLGVEIIPNHADFRLLGRRALVALQKYRETNLFLRAIIPLLGFKQEIVTYERQPRSAGVSKYPLRKMISLGLNGITSFSMRPLRIITVIGIVTAVLAFLFGAWAILAWFFSWPVIPGWTSIIAPMMFLSGVQLLALGIVGEYLGKAYMEVKQRPRYEIETIKGADALRVSEAARSA